MAKRKPVKAKGGGQGGANVPGQAARQQEQSQPWKAVGKFAGGKPAPPRTTQSRGH